MYMNVEFPRVRTGLWIALLSFEFKICVLKFSATSLRARR